MKDEPFSKQNERADSWGEEDTKSEIDPHWESAAKDKLALANKILLGLSILYILITAAHLCPDSWIDSKTSETVFTNFSFFASNAVMLIFGYYFGQK